MLVLGVLSLVLCQVIGPFAWVIGNRVVLEIDAQQGRLGGRNLASIGRTLGTISTCLLGLFMVFFAVFLLLPLIGLVLGLASLK